MSTNCRACAHWSTYGCADHSICEGETRKVDHDLESSIFNDTLLRMVKIIYKTNHASELIKELDILQEYQHKYRTLHMDDF